MSRFVYKEQKESTFVGIITLLSNGDQSLYRAVLLNLYFYHFCSFQQQKLQEKERNIAVQLQLQFMHEIIMRINWYYVNSVKLWHIWTLIIWLKRKKNTRSTLPIKQRMGIYVFCHVFRYIKKLTSKIIKSNLKLKKKKKLFKTNIQ